MKLGIKSVIWGILVLLIIGLFIVLILCSIGVINRVNSGCGLSKEISFSAAASGQVQLSWNYDTTSVESRKSTDIDFPVNIWYTDPSSGNPSADKIVTLVSWQTRLKL